MKTIISAVIILLAVNAAPAFAEENPRCKEVADIQTQISEIQNFIKNSSALSEVAYFQKLGDLNESTTKISNGVKGCSPESDNLLVQMKDAIDLLLAAKGNTQA